MDFKLASSSWNFLGAFYFLYKDELIGFAVICLLILIASGEVSDIRMFLVIEIFRICKLIIITVRTLYYPKTATMFKQFELISPKIMTPPLISFGC